MFAKLKRKEKYRIRGFQVSFLASYYITKQKENSSPIPHDHLLFQQNIYKHVLILKTNSYIRIT